MICEQNWELSPLLSLSVKSCWSGSNIVFVSSRNKIEGCNKVTVTFINSNPFLCPGHQKPCCQHQLLVPRQMLEALGSSEDQPASSLPQGCFIWQNIPPQGISCTNLFFKEATNERILESKEHNVFSLLETLRSSCKEWFITYVRKKIKTAQASDIVHMKRGKSCIFPVVC